MKVVKEVNVAGTYDAQSHVASFPAMQCLLHFHFHQLSSHILASTILANFDLEVTLTSS